MRELRFSGAARRDLASIREESERTWGSEQRDRYVDELRQRLQRLRDRPVLGPAVGAVRPGLRRFHSGAHIVFYRFDEAQVFVVRILHQRMDIDLHLGRGR